MSCTSSYDALQLDEQLLHTGERFLYRFCPSILGSLVFVFRPPINQLLKTPIPRLKDSPAIRNPG